MTEQDIMKFQQLYKDEFGIDISKEEAAEQGLKLVTLMSHVYKPMTIEESRQADNFRHSRCDGLISRLHKELK